MARGRRLPRRLRRARTGTRRRPLGGRRSRPRTASTSSDPTATRTRSAAAWSALAGLAAHRGAKKDWRGPDLGAVKAALRHLRTPARAAWDDGGGPAGLAWSALDERAAAIVAQVRDALEGALAIVDERKRRAKALSFADLETHALRALEHPDVRAQVHAALARAAPRRGAGRQPDPGARCSRRCGPADAPLTAVGDAKQSIYGFRGAEPGVLAGLRAAVAVEDGGRTVALGTNYRSHGELVQSLNRVFDRALGADAGPLAAARERPAGLPPTLRYQRVARPPRAPVRRTGRPPRSDAIAGAILGWVRADPPIAIAAAADGPRPLGFDDVAVLARGRATLAVLEARLPALGVPVLNAGGGDVLAHPPGLGRPRPAAGGGRPDRRGVAAAALLRSP